MTRTLFLTIAVALLLAALGGCASNQLAETGPDIGPAPVYLQEVPLPTAKASDFVFSSAKESRESLKTANSIICSARYEWNLMRDAIKDRKAVSERAAAEIPPECKPQTETPDKKKRKAKAAA